MSRYYDDRYGRGYPSYSDSRRRETHHWTQRSDRYRPYESSSSSYYGSARRSGSRASYDHSNEYRPAYRSFDASRSTGYTSRTYPHSRSDSDRDRLTADARQVQSSEKPKDRRGINEKDMGYAFLGSKKFEYVIKQLRGQLRSDAGHSGSTLDDHTPSLQELTPRCIVEESKRSGHFDAVRKQMLLAFQASEFKQPFLDRLDAYLMRKLEVMSPRRRHRLAAQEQHLQHSELNRWVGEGRGSADVFDRLFASLRGDRDSSWRKLVEPDDEEKGDEGLLNGKNGKLAKEITTRLEEIIQSERQRLDSIRSGERDSDEEGTSTPAVKSSATPLGRETPHDADSSGGQQTPTSAMQHK